MLTETQQAQRLKGIGASEVGAVLGLDKYRSPLDVYLEKTGALPPFEGNEFTRWGNILEPVLASEYADQNPGVVLHTSETLQHREIEWALATPDRIVDHRSGRWLLECKNKGFHPGQQFGPSGTDEVPDAIAVQCQWQMLVTELSRCDVAVLVGGNDFRTYQLSRNDTLIDSMVEIVEAFWRGNVEAGIPPEVRDTDTETVKRLFPASTDELMEGTPELYEQLRMRQDAKAEVEDLEKQIAELEAAVKLVIGPKAGLLFADGSKCTWKSTKAGTRVDWEALAGRFLNGLASDERDAVIAEFTREKPGYRRFLVNLKEVA